MNLETPLPPTTGSVVVHSTVWLFPKIHVTSSETQCSHVFNHSQNLYNEYGFSDPSLFNANSLLYTAWGWGEGREWEGTPFHYTQPSYRKVMGAHLTRIQLLDYLRNVLASWCLIYISRHYPLILTLSICICVPVTPLPNYGGEQGQALSLQHTVNQHACAKLTLFIINSWLLYSC